MRTTSVMELHIGERHRAANWGQGSTGVAGSTVTCIITQAPNILYTCETHAPSFRREFNCPPSLRLCWQISASSVRPRSNPIGRARPCIDIDLLLLTDMILQSDGNRGEQAIEVGLSAARLKLFWQEIWMSSNFSFYG